MFVILYLFCFPLVFINNKQTMNYNSFPTVTQLFLRLFLLPNTGYCYPIAGPAKNGFNPAHRCEYSSAKIGDNYYEDICLK